MSATESQPISFNQQAPQNFVFNIKRLPSIDYFCVKAKIPSLSLPAAKVPTASLDVPKPGDHLVYEPLTLTFNIDSMLQNWIEIHNWMTAIGDPTNRATKYLQLEKNGSISPYGLVSDITLFKTDSQNNPDFTWTFKDAWPTYLSGWEFDSTNPNVSYLVSTVMFRYVRFKIEAIQV